MNPIKENDIIDKIFNNLSVVSYEGYSYSGKSKNHLYNCRCECGNECIIKRGDLLNGNKKSCGCLRTKRLIEYNKTEKIKRNAYDLSSDYGVGWTTNTNKEFYFDLEDYNKIKDYTWLETDKGYLLCTRNNDHGKKVKFYFHRLVMDYNEYKDIDHVDKNPMNNKKENLRICEHSLNSKNRKIPSTNTSGFIGVGFCKNRNSWTSNITIDGKRIVKHFRNKEGAIISRLKSEKLYFGEFAPQRHLFEQYNI